jgi:hypothetical protein
MRSGLRNRHIRLATIPVILNRWRIFVKRLVDSIVVFWFEIQGRAALKMEAARLFEALASTYKTAFSQPKRRQNENSPPAKSKILYRFEAYYF